MSVYIESAVRTVCATIDEQMKPMDEDQRKEFICALHERMAERICHFFEKERAEREHRLRHFDSVSPAGANWGGEEAE